MKAKEMFEELGYYEESNTLKLKNGTLLYAIKHFISDTTYVEFYKKDNSFSKYTISDSSFENAKVENITYKELQAINKQVEEIKYFKEYEEK